MKRFASLVILSFLTLPAFGAEHLIGQKGKQFDQREIKIKKGDTLTFQNQEQDITHNVFSLGPKNEFELVAQPPGSKASVVLKQVGTTDIQCAIHPSMKLKVTVEP